MIDHIKLTKTEFSVDEMYDDEFLDEEEFFQILAGAINRVGQWCLEIHGTEKATYNNDEAQIAKYREVFQSIINRAIQLFDTDNPKIALPLLEFLTMFIKTYEKSLGV